MHSDRCSQHHACTGVYVKQVLCASAYTFAYTLATGCAYALMYAQFVHLRCGMRMRGFSYFMRALVAWRGGVFLTEGKIRVLSVSSLFLMWVGLYVGVGLCIRRHTHTLHRWCTLF